MTLEQEILQELELRPLSTEELVHRFPNTPIGILNTALYNLREQKFWVEKHPVIEGGCKTCACSIRYSWRLTFAGREELVNVRKSG